MHALYASSTRSVSDLSTTRAWKITERGWLPETLKLSHHVPIPHPAAGEVQVQVKFAALNPCDAKLASLFPRILQKLPRTAASDFSGVITAVGPGPHPEWATKGRRVYGFFSPAKSQKDQRGSLQEFVTTSTKFIQPTPDDYTDEEVAGVTMAGLAALALTDRVKQSDRVLIIGGSTAVGFLVADLAKARGASFVVATASGLKAAFVRSRGVSSTVDYRKYDAGTELARRYGKHPFDLVLDCVGQRSVYSNCARFLKPSGTYLSLSTSILTAKTTLTSPEFRQTVAWNLDAVIPRPSCLGGVPRKFKQLFLDDSRMEELGQLVDAAVLRPVFDREYTFEEAPRAYAYLIKGRATGKVLVQVAPVEFP